MVILAIEAETPEMDLLIGLREGRRAVGPTLHSNDDVSNCLNPPGWQVSEDIKRKIRGQT